MQKLIDLIDKFDGGDCDENEARKTSASTKRPTKADYLSFNYVNYAVSKFISNSAKIVNNYLIPGIKRAFDQLRQAFIKALIFYTSIRNDTSGLKLTRLGILLVEC